MRYFDVFTGRWLSVLFGAALLCSCVFSIGCEQKPPGSNRPRGESTLVITCDGLPVPGAVVSLDNLTTGEAGGGITDRTGKARLTNVVCGTYQVTVRPPEKEFVPDQELGENDTTDDDAAETDPFAELIPEKYRSLETTPLTLEVKEEILEYQFDLKKGDAKEDDAKENAPNDGAGKKGE